MANPLLDSLARLQTLQFGTRFYKADLHFHTPASSDARGTDKYDFNPYDVAFAKKDNNPDYFSQWNTTKGDLLDKAKVLASKMVAEFLAKGVGIVAVTDHNGIGTLWNDPEARRGKMMDQAAPTWYEVIDDEAQNVNLAMGQTELLILPGVEISTTGVHILAIFPPQDPRRKVHFMICDLLNDLGFAPNDWGQNPKVGRASVQDTIELIQKKGGLPIPAHIDAFDQALLKLYKLKSGAMENVLKSPVLRAVEIVDPDNFSKVDKELKQPVKAWIDELRGENGLPSLAYFQGSDAHDLSAIAKRFTYLKMTEPTFSGLHTAIKMPASRVRITASYKEFDGLCILGMAIKHPFLGEQELRYNRNLNCIAGKKGTGKSTICKLIQSALDPASPPPEGDVVVFLEQVTAGASSYYAFGRKTGQPAAEACALDPNAGTVSPLAPAQAQAISRQLKFHDPVLVEAMVKDPVNLQAYLQNTFGPPTPENVKAFNEKFSTPRFLDNQKDPLLKLSADANGYKLTVNEQWRVGKPSMKDFFSLSIGLRRSILMSIDIMNSDVGPVMIDAPEQQFDNEDMIKLLVPIIREHKDSHQILLFTDHPILAVNTDPDNYLLLQAQGAQLKNIVSGFAADNTDQQPLLLQILEGSLEAIRKRANLYDLC